jgi:hypothetical protein
MNRRVIGYPIGAVGLLAVALLLPPGTGRATAQPATPAKLAADLALVPGDCGLFLTYRPVDFAEDNLMSAFAEASHMGDDLERQSGLKLSEVERVTLVLSGQSDIEIIRASKPLDKEKVLAKLPKPFIYDKDKGKPLAPTLLEKKVGDKTMYYYGVADRPPDRWVSGVCLVNGQVLMRGTVANLEAALNTKAKRSAQLNELLGRASSHTFALGMQGKELRRALRREFSNSPWQPAGKDKVKDKEDKDSEFVLPPFVAAVAAPYKPLMMAKVGLVTANINKGKGYTATVKGTFDSAEATDEGETALKTTLYVLRELTASLTKYEARMRPLAPLAGVVQTALKEVKVQRTGTTLEATMSLPAAPDVLVKKIRDDIAAERKREEERLKKSTIKPSPPAEKK